MLSELSYELSVLCKAVHHKNLSAAASHIGLSQPQLSRVVAKLEESLNIVLLDRSARRKSSWTQVAHDLSTVYQKGIGRVEAEVLALAEDREVTELHVGTLEGLSSIARDFTEKAFGQIGIKKLFLDVLEFESLDSQFLGGNLDLIFTVRPPSKQKFQRILEVGYQQAEKYSSGTETFVLSPTELLSVDKKEFENYDHVLISNSLAIRKQWLTELGGTGSLPTSAQKGKGRGHYSVFLFGNDLLSPRMWSKILELY